ncbi:MAG: hypothetical protein ABR584_00490 [Candidatus Baltobacteraceae bacterium]
MQRRRAPATALFLLMLASCAHKEPPPLAISGCRIDGKPVTVIENFGRLHDRRYSHTFDVRVPVTTMYATAQNVSEKTIVSTRLSYAYRLGGQAFPHPLGTVDNYWRIPPHHTVRMKWYKQSPKASRWKLDSQTIPCSLFAVSFADGSIWASVPGEVPPGEADRHHGPL